MQNVFKIVMFGAEGVGKDAYITRLKYGEFERGYKPSTGTKVRSLMFNTEFGMVEFQILVVAGSVAKVGNPIMKTVEQDLNTAHGVIIMYDATNPFHASEVYDYQQIVARHNVKNVLVVANKIDQIAFVKGNPPKQIKGHVAVSARTNYHFEVPFLKLTRSLMNKPKLEFIENRPISAPFASGSDDLTRFEEIIRETVTN